MSMLSVYIIVSVGSFLMGLLIGFLVLVKTVVHIDNYYKAREYRLVEMYRETCDY